jgi:hypothetical protein
MKTWALSSGIILMLSIMGGFIAGQPAAMSPRAYCANAKMGLFVHYTLGT